MSPGILWVSLLTIAAGLSNRDELFEKYSEIFPNRNRNAASHRWATYILERSAEMSAVTMRDLFAGFCPVSGSPLSYQRRELRVNMTLPLVSGGTATGMVYYCCWPCVCDTADFIKVDTKTVSMADGAQQLHFLVIGNPCVRQDAIPIQAPDVNCGSQGRLEKAMLSDHGHIIIGMMYEIGIGEHSSSQEQSTSQKEFGTMCEQRASSGYRSGMGEIFRQVAAIAPIDVSVQPASTQAAAASSATRNASSQGSADAQVSRSTDSASPLAEGTSIASGIHMEWLNYLVIAVSMYAALLKI
jgi:hypothetical protein